MIAQGDRIGGFFNYGVGAGQHSGGVNVQSPGLFQGGNNVALGVKTDGVYVNGSGLQLTTSWSLAQPRALLGAKLLSRRTWAVR
jgi:hypothetical protein